MKNAVLLFFLLGCFGVLNSQSITRKKIDQYQADTCRDYHSLTEIEYSSERKICKGKGDTLSIKQYNEKGKLVQINGVRPAIFTQQFEYNQAGFLIQILNIHNNKKSTTHKILWDKNQVVETQSDCIQRTSSAFYKYNQKDQLIHETFFDCNGNLLSEREYLHKGDTTFSYDITNGNRKLLRKEFKNKAGNLRTELSFVNPINDTTLVFQSDSLFEVRANKGIVLFRQVSTQKNMYKYYFDETGRLLASEVHDILLKRVQNIYFYDEKKRLEKIRVFKWE